MSHIEVAFDGRLGAAPQARTTSAGKPMATFSVAVGRGDETPNFGVPGFHYFWTALDSVTRMDPEDSYRAAI